MRLAGIGNVITAREEHGYRHTKDEVVDRPQITSAKVQAPRAEARSIQNRRFEPLWRFPAKRHATQALSAARAVTMSSK